MKVEKSKSGLQGECPSNRGSNLLMIFKIMVVLLQVTIDSSDSSTFCHIRLVNFWLKFVIQKFNVRLLIDGHSLLYVLISTKTW